MKTIRFTLALLLLCSIGYAQSATDEKAVRAVIQKMDDAWNAHDYTYSGKYDIYDQNAMMINPVGMYWKGKGEIVKAHQVFGETMFKHSSAKSQIIDMRFPAPTVAVAIIKAQYLVEQDHNLPGGQIAVPKGSTSQGMINVVLNKKDEAWKILSLQVTTVDQNAVMMYMSSFLCVR
jgi:uncharacterized protein (TIGR02246 family)